MAAKSIMIEDVRGQQIVLKRKVVAELEVGSYYYTIFESYDDEGTPKHAYDVCFVSNGKLTLAGTDKPRKALRFAATQQVRTYGELTEKCSFYGPIGFIAPPVKELDE